MDPIIFDPVLGEFVFDEGLNWYAGEMNSPGHGPISVAVSLDEQPSADLALGEARELIPLVLAAIQAAKEHACDQLLALKNASWLEEGQEAVSREEFIRKLEVEGVNSYAGRTCELFFGDGDLFWGHSVLMSWNEVQGFHDATIAG